MRNDDQWFKPGDKVMRVGNNAPGATVIKFPGEKKPVSGVVYCVEDFMERPPVNMVMLVGFGGWHTGSKGQPIGYAASAFRKVEEIKLCVAAVERMKKPVETTAPEYLNPR